MFLALVAGILKAGSSVPEWDDSSSVLRLREGVRDRDDARSLRKALILLAVEIAGRDGS